ncbi:MAG: DPP IV N-terminal domain-containing protein, partial [Planctomycetota bacterium]
MTTPVRLIVLTVIVLLAPVSADAEPLTLEQIYPESGLFADPASDFSFSHDGRFVAFEYRPFAERRHGNDVYVYDVETQAARRVTGVEVFAKFRRGARDVVRDREQALAADGPTTRPTRLAEALPDIGIFGVEEPPLPADDAERENAPEYNGINSFQWSPTADEMLVVAGGDVYRLTIDRDKWDADPDYRGDLERVTRTRRGESGVRYLPDGSGFTHWVDGGVMLVKFGTARQVQIDPPLRDDERLVGYRISPDGKRAVLLGAKNQTHPGQYTEVLMVRYGDRFAEPETLRRRLPDAEAPNGQMSIYLYDLTRNLTEGARPTRVYTRQIRGQRDLMVVPDWSPDSKRIAFAEYEQTSGRVTIWESVVGERSARPIYRFLHDGAPATPRRIVPHYLADSRRLAFITDRTGYRHLFVLDPLYEELRQLTHGRREIEVLGISPDAQRMFFTATVEDDPASETLHAVELDSGESWQIDDGEGRVTAAAVAPDGRHALFIRKHFGRPPFPVLATPDGEIEIGNFHPEPTHRETLARPEYFAFENRHGHTVHGHMFKPADWAATDRRPMLMFVYAGPIGSGRNMTARGSYN